MSQPCVVNAFRKRLRLRGFRDISIISHGLFYHVSFIDPFGFPCDFGITETRMQHVFKSRIR